MGICHALKWSTLLAAGLALLIAPDRLLAQTGKCCLPDGRGCVNATSEQCDGAGGTFVAGQMCASPDDTCDGPVMGACCPPGAACAFVVSTQCTGTFFAGTACTPTLCPSPAMGACCRGGTCMSTLRDPCMGDGGEWYEATACSPDFCRLGACCSGPLSCVIVSLSGCEQGTWTADGTCAPIFCNSFVGTCCRSTGVCVVTTDEDCPNGTFVGGNVCLPDTCAALLGACCQGTACAVSAAADCNSSGGQFAGVGTACGAPGNPTTCCPANFNGVGGLSVQDIFDFLAAYFANDPSADFNRSGGVTVQDIFDFLAAYFGGCE